jgi:hypothetical protein
MLFPSWSRALPTSCSLDDEDASLRDYLDYEEIEFLGEWTHARREARRERRSVDACARHRAWPPGRGGCDFALCKGENTLFAGVTNEDGRVPGMLGEDMCLPSAPYRLVFAVADYFRAAGVDMPDPPFLDVVVIDFAVSDPASTIMCRCWSRRTAIPPIGAAEPQANQATIRFLLDGEDARSVRGVDPTRPRSTCALPAAPHGDQGRLRRGRLRCVHRAGGRTRRGGRDLARGQQLHPVRCRCSTARR